MKYKNDQRVVLTLDAGGTNFVFSAVQGHEEVVEPLTFPSSAHNLDLCLKTIIKGFKQVLDKLTVRPAAISFAFPGPADYPNGIIGDLGNLPAFRGGVPLAAILRHAFDLPVFINNDGNLFALGEAIAGFLPHVNERLRESGSPKRYKNLLGVTLGTGFGGGIILDGNMLVGDNSAAGEIWLMRHKLDRDNFAEEGVSIRAIKRFYAQAANITHTNPDSLPEPKDIFAIATGEKEGHREAAQTAFIRMGEILGDALANAATMVDGLICIGGGLSGAHRLFLPKVVEEMNGKIGSVNRLEVKSFNLENNTQMDQFLKGEQKRVPVPGTTQWVEYDPLQRIGVGISRLDTARAVSIGAYAFALSALDGLG